jgi:hypothetical protein
MIVVTTTYSYVTTLQKSYCKVTILQYTPEILSIRSNDVGSDDPGLVVMRLCAITILHVCRMYRADS